MDVLEVFEMTPDDIHKLAEQVFYSPNTSEHQYRQGQQVYSALLACADVVETVHAFHNDVRGTLNPVLDALARLRVAVECIQSVLSECETWMQSPTGQDVMEHRAERQNVEAFVATLRDTLREIGEVPK
jgi:hypothetical protein